MTSSEVTVADRTTKQQEAVQAFETIVAGLSEKSLNSLFSAVRT
jgi:hypothetical protein